MIWTSERAPLSPASSFYQQLNSGGCEAFFRTGVRFPARRKESPGVAEELHLRRTCREQIYREAAGPARPPGWRPPDAQEPRWASSRSSAPPAHFTGEKTGVERHRSKCWSQNLSLGLSRPVPKTVLVSGLYTLSPRNASSSKKVQPSPASRPEEPPPTLPFPNRDGPQRRTIEFLDPAAPRPACEQAVRGRKSDLVNKSSEWWRQGNLPGGSRPCQIASSILAIF